MRRFRYIIHRVEGDWTEHLYHTDIRVVGGICETADELAITALLRRGYEEITAEPEVAPAPAPEAAPEAAPAPVAAPARARARARS